MLAEGESDTAGVVVLVFAGAEEEEFSGLRRGGVRVIGRQDLLREPDSVVGIAPRSRSQGENVGSERDGVLQTQAKHIPVICPVCIGKGRPVGREEIDEFICELGVADAVVVERNRKEVRRVHGHAGPVDIGNVERRGDRRGRGAVRGNDEGLGMKLRPLSIDGADGELPADLPEQTRVDRDDIAGRSVVSLEKNRARKIRRAGEPASGEIEPCHPGRLGILVGRGADAHRETIGDTNRDGSAVVDDLEIDRGLDGKKAAARNVPLRTEEDSVGLGGRPEVGQLVVVRKRPFVVMEIVPSAVIPATCCRRQAMISGSLRPFTAIP